MADLQPGTLHIILTGGSVPAKRKGIKSTNGLSGIGNNQGWAVLDASGLEAAAAAQLQVVGPALQAAGGVLHGWDM